MRTLAIDTSGVACSIALIDGQDVAAERHEALGRGHAERLIPWIAALLEGGRADRIVVGCGPGSFTGVRIGISAARGLGLGWGVPVDGVSSLALIAADMQEARLTLAIEGGHGEVFVQNFGLDADAVRSLPVVEAAAFAREHLVVGNAASRVVQARGWGTAVDAAPRAANARLMTRFQPPLPVYGRGADARPMVSWMIVAQIRDADVRDIPRIMTVMNKAFEPAHGEAWTAPQCVSALALPGTLAILAEAGERTLGFAIARHVLDEAELLLIAVRPDSQSSGVGGRLLGEVIERIAAQGGNILHLEMREDNPALVFYQRREFVSVGRRMGYYRRSDGTVSDALTLSRRLWMPYRL